MILGRTIVLSVMVLILVGALALILVEDGSTAPYLPSDAFYPQITIEGTPIKVEVVDQQAALERGLSGREAMTPFHGMLFVFQKDEYWGIWMKDMKFPIDVLWLDSEKRVVHIEQHLLPASYPRVYRPPVPARYVIELPASSVEAFNFTVGNQAAF